jgi:galactose oxidase
MTRSVLRAAVVIGVTAISMAGVTPLRANPAVDGAWTSAFTWGQAGGIEAVHTFMLPTGKVLFWSTYQASVGLWDPATDTFSAPGNAPAFNPFCSGHAWLPDGRLLVAGGHISNYNGENRADIYNPFTNLWSNADPNTPDVPVMGTTSTNTAATGKRWYPSATSLGNGDVIVMSGDVTQQGVTNRSVEIYQTATNTWRTLTGALRPANDLLPEYPRVFQAPDGRAISMSDNSNGTEYLDISGNGTWSNVQNTLDPNLHNYGPAVMYDTGKIAYIGGGNTPTRNISMIDLNSSTPSWRYGGGGTVAPAVGSPYVMARARRQDNATILANGKVLVTGGTDVTGWNDPNGLVATAEVWDPATEIVSQVATANVAIYRGYHSTALLLPDGRVLVTGGDHDYSSPIPQQNTNAEIYSPAYLFASDGSPAVRPTVTAAPTVAELGDTIFVGTPDAASISKAFWVVPGAVTHSQNWTQRANNLEFSAVDGGLSIKLPANQNEAPIGYYMLFLVNDQGTPSVAKFIRATPNIVLTGDFNDDHIVDAADYTVWRDKFGAPYTQDDYEAWKLHFGESVGSGASLTDGATAAVPEPNTCLLLAIGLLVAIGPIRQRKIACLR